MRRIYIVAQNYQRADAMFQLLNKHSRRSRMELVAVTRPEQLKGQARGGTAILVTPMLDVRLVGEFEQVLRERGFAWSECESDGGYVLGELL